MPEDQGYRGIEEGQKIAVALTEKGVDGLHVDVGCHDNWALAMPPIYQQAMAPQIDVARQIKAVTPLPVISNGRLGDLGKVESGITNQWLDVAAVGRQFLADPDFVTKLIANQPEKIRACIYCNEGCIKSVAEGKRISCAVNPLVGKESLSPSLMTDKPQNVLVIGAGPGGCEAAITAKQRGHKVTLWEKEAYLGGNFYNACLPPFKRDGNKLLKYYQQMISELEIETKYSYHATLGKISALEPDQIIYACGGTSIVPPIPGVNQGHVTTAIEALQDRGIIGEKVVVIGGGLVGCETALTLVNQGKEVTIIEMADKLLPEPLFIQNLMMLTDLLEKSAIKAIVGGKVTEIQKNTITLMKDEEIETLTCDTVVLATGFKPNQALYQELVGAGFAIKNVGDSVAVRKVFEAVHEGYEAVMAIQ